MKRIHEREFDGVDEGDGWEQEEEEVGGQEGGRDSGGVNAGEWERNGSGKGFITGAIPSKIHFAKS